MKKVALIKFISSTIADKLPSYVRNDNNEGDLLVVNIYAIVDRVYNVDIDYYKLNLLYTNDTNVNPEEYVKFFVEQLVYAHTIGVDINYYIWQLKVLSEVCFEEVYNINDSDDFVKLLENLTNDFATNREYVQRYIALKKKLGEIMAIIG